MGPPLLHIRLMQCHSEPSPMIVLTTSQDHYWTLHTPSPQPLGRQPVYVEYFGQNVMKKQLARSIRTGTAGGPDMPDTPVDGDVAAGEVL